jgi:hypothetical protein
MAIVKSATKESLMYVRKLQVRRATRESPSLDNFVAKIEETPSGETRRLMAAWCGIGGDGGRGDGWRMGRGVWS